MKNNLLFKARTRRMPFSLLQFALLFWVTISSAQSIPISGTVFDAQGPLPSVNVTLKNKTVGTTTDANGNFQITASAEDTLVFSSMGYLTVETVVGQQTTLKIILQPDENVLEEVLVNAGYYKVKDKERTGSIAKITAKEIETQPVTNVLAAMQGRMAGVNIVQESGIAGGGFKINIRGINSLRAEGNAPLYIIDGVPYSSDPISDRQTSTSTPGDGNPLGSINPNDIEGIEVLKDADATAIYGSRGANGVVLITTKKGKSGKTKVTINTQHSIGRVTKMIKMMNTEQYLKMRREAFANEGIINYPQNAYDINGTWDQNRYTDWQKELIGGTAETLFMQASVSGGTEQSNFLFSSNYRTESSVFPGDFLYKKGGARLAFNHNSEDKRFAFNFSASYMSQDNNLPWMDYTTLAAELAPNAPALYDAEGNLNWENNTWENPLANSESKSLSKTDDLITNAVIAYQLTNSITIKSNLGFTNLKNEDSRSLPSTMYNPAYNLTSQQSSIYWNDFARRSWIIEPQVNYIKTAGKSAFNLLAGATFQNQKSKKMAAESSLFSSNSLLYNYAAAAQTIIYNNEQTEYKYQAFFGRMNYSYDNRYILNLTGRRDGSSRFGQGKQFATFGAVGLAWLLSNENFMKDHLQIISSAKIRSSYGTTGSDQIGDYQFLNTYNNSSFQYGGVIGLQPARLYNPNFSWETNRKAEIALEMGTLKDRIFLTTSYYNNRSSNQLVGLPLPETTGFNSIQENLNAEVENFGWEATLRLVPIKLKEFSWTVDFNITKAGNKLLSFPGLENSAYRSQLVVGQPTSIRKLFNYTGVDPQTGLYQFEDVNGDGIISFENDRETLRDFNPEFYGGLQNQFTYKNLQLDFLLQFVKQENYNFANMHRSAGQFSNKPIEYLNSWSQVGDNAPYQLFATNGNQLASQASEFFSNSTGAVSDASFIRLKNVSLTYNLPKKLIPGIGCTISLQAQNLLTITSYKGADPEFTNGGTLPPLRIFALGLQVTF